MVAFDSDRRRAITLRIVLFGTAVCGAVVAKGAAAGLRCGRRPAAAAAAGAAARAARQRRLDIRLDDAAIRAGALHARRGRAPPAAPCAARAARRRRDRRPQGGSGCGLSAACAAAVLPRPARGGLRAPVPGRRAWQRARPTAPPRLPRPARRSRSFTFTPSVPSGTRILPSDALIDGLDLHRRLVGLDLGDHVAGLDARRLPS